MMNKKYLEDMLTVLEYNVKRFHELANIDMKNGVNYLDSFGEHKECLKNIRRLSLRLYKAFFDTDEHGKEYPNAVGEKK